LQFPRRRSLGKIRDMRNGFHRDLAVYGPQRSYAPPPLPRARAYCSRLTHAHYENFTVASLLLPKRLRPHFHAVYAFCRWADDLGDETGGGQRALALLRWWRDELLCCYHARPHHPVMVALADTIKTFNIPKRPFLELLYAFEQDQLIKRYRTFSQLLNYCRFSANPVGHLVLYLCRAHDERRAALSDHICTGLQLANFWQDVARDYAIDRVYLPEEDRRRFGYTYDDLRQRRFTPAFGDLMRHLVDRTRDQFYRGLPLVELMPRDVRSDVELFVRGGLAILHKIEQVHYNVWLQRPTLAKWEKAALVGGAMWRRVRDAFW
jgi:squalene synthase HpnC